jgi:hypothetical protein
MSLLDAYAPVPSRCDLGDHSLCEHAPAEISLPIMLDHVCSLACPCRADLAD